MKSGAKISPVVEVTDFDDMFAKDYFKKLSETTYSEVTIMSNNIGSE
jgi:hypothetical protein